ncbi:hypothetical protein QAD02_013083 [Eretmocerus hayati]|uniref:Uncharacterized protein n=1 Tax=Eretmocerus hayati TaxID=131215 RepID=A0ACC2P2K9_9HYME|nr:hypothetical protein QAD02_013083 [Eretmocerus hayati]
MERLLRPVRVIGPQERRIINIVYRKGRLGRNHRPVQPVVQPIAQPVPGHGRIRDVEPPLPPPPPPPPAPRPQRRQRYRFEWHTHGWTWRWLRPDPDDVHRARCLFCEWSYPHLLQPGRFNAHRRTIGDHFISARHTGATQLWDRVRGLNNSEGVFNRIIESLELFKTIPPENLQEFVADGAAHMMGARNSVATRFATHFANITCTICANYSAALCARHAALDEDAIPLHVIHLGRDIHTFINTPHRKNILQQQQECNSADRKNGQSIIEDSSPFLESYPTDNGKLEWVDATNDVVLPGVYFHIKEALLDILDCILHRDYYQSTPVEEIDPQDPRHHRNPLEMTIGRPCLEQILLIREPGNEALERIQRYLIRLATQVSQRLERYWRAYAGLECFLPQNAISVEYHAENPGVIREVMDRFPRALHGVNAEVIEDEWDQLLQHHPQLHPDMEIDRFWDQVRDFQVPLADQHQNPNRRAILTNLGQFAMNLLVMSHSNAEAERGFSAERLVWTRIRVLLDLSTTEGILLMRNCNRIHGNHGHAARFEPCVTLRDVRLGWKPFSLCYVQLLWLNLHLHRSSGSSAITFLKLSKKSGLAALDMQIVAVLFQQVPWVSAFSSESGWTGGIINALNNVEISGLQPYGI